MLANGASDYEFATQTRNGEFPAALTQVCADLAKQIVRDGEGATKFVEMNITGARDEAEAARVAKAIANSPLAKTALLVATPIGDALSRRQDILARRLNQRK